MFTKTRIISFKHRSIYLKSLPQNMQEDGIQYTKGINKSKWKAPYNKSFKFIDQRYIFSFIKKDHDIYIIKSNDVIESIPGTYRASEIEIKKSYNLNNRNTFELLDDNGFVLDVTDIYEVMHIADELFECESVEGLKWLMQKLPEGSSKQRVANKLLMLFCKNGNKKVIQEMIHANAIYYDIRFGDLLEYCYDNGLEDMANFLLQLMPTHKIELLISIIENGNFLMACRNDNIDNLKRCMTKDVNYKEGFILACRMQQTNTAKFIWNILSVKEKKMMLSAESVNDKTGVYLISVAIAQKNNIELVDFFFEMIKSVNSPIFLTNHYMNTFLLEISKTCQIDLVKYVYEKSKQQFDIVVSREFVEAMFKFAGHNNNLVVMSWIYNNFKFNYNNFSYLFDHAALNNNISTMQWLLNHRDKFSVDFHSAFKYSIHNGNSKMAQYIMELINSYKVNMKIGCVNIKVEHDDINIYEVNVRRCINGRHYDTLKYLQYLDKENKLQINKYIE